MAFQLRAQSKDRQSIERISGESIQGVENSETNGRAAAESARLRHISSGDAGKRKRTRARLFEE
jgi:hypothetical protein